MVCITNIITKMHSRSRNVNVDLFNEHALKSLWARHFIGVYASWNLVTIFFLEKSQIRDF